jgi:hypothetical protein
MSVFISYSFKAGSKRAVRGEDLEWSLISQMRKKCSLEKGSRRMMSRRRDEVADGCK